MRVRGDNAPSNAFSLEEQPNKPGVALVRFYENAEPFEEKRDELTISGWVYDEYHLELNMYDGLSEDILGNYAGYLAQAKLHEAEGKTIPLPAAAGSRPGDRQGGIDGKGDEP